MTRYLDEPSRRDLNRKKNKKKKTTSSKKRVPENSTRRSTFEDRSPSKRISEDRISEGNTGRKRTPDRPERSSRSISSDRRHDYYDMQPVRKKRRKKKKSKFAKRFNKRFKRFRKNTKGKLFWWLLLVYVVILACLGLMFLNYTDKCLMQYELAQSDSYMKEIKESVAEAIAEGNIPEGIDVGAANPFDDPNAAYNNFFAVAKSGELRYEKAAGSYDTENPEYIIYSGDNALIDVKLAGTNPRTIFGILTIMDWEVTSKEVAFVSEGRDITISIPDGFNTSINGIPVGDEYLSGNSADVELFQYASEYCQLPAIKEYVVPGIPDNAVIQVTDNNGEQVDVTAQGNNYSAFFKGLDTVPQPFYDIALGRAETWSLFMSRDLTGDANGVGKILEHLIKNSYYYNMANDYARSIDITFISGHTLTDDTFTNVVLDDFVQYNEDCFSCHIYFEKNMILKNGNAMSDITDSTFIFVNYDDSDDGVDNKHWCIVDMIASTDNAE